MRNHSAKCALALLGSLAIGVSTAFAETVVIDRDPAVVVKPPTVVVNPAGSSEGRGRSGRPRQTARPS